MSRPGAPERNVFILSCILDMFYCDEKPDEMSRPNVYDCFYLDPVKVRCWMDCRKRENAVRRARAAAATAAQIQNFCEKFFKNSLSTKWRHYSTICWRRPNSSEGIRRHPIPNNKNTSRQGRHIPNLPKTQKTSKIANWSPMLQVILLEQKQTFWFGVISQSHLCWVWKDG